MSITEFVPRKCEALKYAVKCEAYMSYTVKKGFTIRALALKCLEAICRLVKVKNVQCITHPVGV